MKGVKSGVFIALLAGVLSLVSMPVLASDPSGLEATVQELIKQNRELTQRLQQVEQELQRLKGQEVSSTVHAAGEKKETGFLSGLDSHVEIGGLLEFGGAYQNVSVRDGRDYDDSDLAMTTVELDLGVEFNEWVSADACFLYEDPTFENNETSIDLDSAVINIGNTEKIPFRLAMGKMYVPFGALLTHFPDDPLIDAPVTLKLGETNEKALLVGYDNRGLSLSAYVYNGDVNEEGETNNRLENYGLDAHISYGIDLSSASLYEKGEKYKHNPENCIDFLLGVSYISNLADSDTIAEVVDDEVEDYVGGFDAYFHAEHCGLFLDAEYMTATDSFARDELLPGQKDAQPAVWNFEAGFNYNWWRNLEVAFKYAGSEDAEGLGIPEDRYGINFNQDLFENVVLSLGYLHDEYAQKDVDNRDDRDLVFGQVAIEF